MQPLQISMATPSIAPFTIAPVSRIAFFADDDTKDVGVDEMFEVASEEIPVGEKVGVTTL